MNTIIEWQAAQACGDCGTDAAFIRQANGFVICHECGHEHEMDRTQLGDCEAFTFISDVLHVTAYAPSDDA